MAFCMSGQKTFGAEEVKGTSRFSHAKPPMAPNSALRQLLPHAPGCAMPGHGTTCLIWRTCARAFNAWDANCGQPYGANGAACHRYRAAGPLWRHATGCGGVGHHQLFRAVYHGVGLWLGCDADGGSGAIQRQQHRCAPRNPHGAVAEPWIWRADFADFLGIGPDLSCTWPRPRGGRAGTAISAHRRFWYVARTDCDRDQKLSGRT